MKRGIVMSAGLSLILCGPVDAAPESPIEAWIREHQAEVAAASVAEITPERVDARGYGRRAGADSTTPDADTQFQLGSITKVFTNLLLAELDAAGTTSYDTTLGTLLPKLRPRNPAVAQISLLALASHRSGLPRLPPNLDLGDTVDPYAGYDTADLLAGLRAARDKQPLGTFYAYSNFGAGALGHALGRAAGSDYARAVTQHVIEPLHLRRTTFQPDADAATAVSAAQPVPAWRFQDALAGAGALWGSVSDLARLVQPYLGAPHGLKHDLTRDLDVVVAEAGAFAVTRVWHVARAGDAPVYWHNGGTAGFHSFVGFRPDQRRGVAILVSGGADPTDAGLRALGVESLQPIPPRIDRSVFGQYALTAAFGIGVYEQGGRLVAQATGQPAFDLHAVGEDWYAFDDVDASVHFLRNEGAVVGLELAQNGVLQSAPRAAATALATARQEIALDRDTLAGYVGRYAFAPGVDLTVRGKGAGLEAQLSGQPFFPIFARAPDRFFYRVVDAELAFERDAEGRVQAVVLHQGGAEQRAARH